jgi:glycosyltransferase involved in cell wall biosynthesis
MDRRGASGVSLDGSTGAPGAARVLWVTDEAPDRELSGGSIRQSYLFEALASAYPTDLLIAGATVGEDARALAKNVTELQTRTAPWTAHPIGRRALSLGISFGSPYPLAAYPAFPARRALARELRERSHRYDLVCVEHASLAPLIPVTRSGRWMITFHHLLSGMIGSEATLAPGRRQRWYRERDERKAQTLERRAVESYDVSIVCSEEDATALAATAGPGAAARIAVVPNGVSTSQYKATPVPSEPAVLFPGYFGYAPNSDGARWFCAEVWPRVRRLVPDATLVLAGRRPTPEVVALGELPSVSVHPDVPSMLPYFRSARAVIVPLRVGTGTRLKALEGMASGRPVIGTTTGLSGLGITDGVQARIADDPAAMADALAEVLRDDALAESLATAGRALVEQRFDWARIGAQLVELAAEALSADRYTASIASR